MTIHSGGNVPLIFEQAINGLTEGALYALRFVCEMNDWSPHLAVAGNRLLLLGTDHFSRIVYFDCAIIPNPGLVAGLKKLRVSAPIGERAPSSVLAQMN